MVPASLGPFPRLNPEFVVRANPDLIMMGNRSMQAMVPYPGWDFHASAVREQRLCVFGPGDSDVVVRPGPRMAEAARIMAQCINDKMARTPRRHRLCLHLSPASSAIDLPTGSASRRAAWPPCRPHGLLAVAGSWPLLAVLLTGLGASVGSTGFDSVLRLARRPCGLPASCGTFACRARLGAWLAGALLGLSGAVAQGLFRNPLADPYLLGSASGASLGVAVAMALFGVSPVPAQWLAKHGHHGGMAFVGAAGAVLLTLLLAQVACSTPCACCWPG